MSKRKSISLLFGVIGLLGSAALISGLTVGTTGVRQKASFSRISPLKETANRDYSGEVDVPAGTLSVSATSSTLTSMGQSFSLTFSTGGQGFGDNTQNFLLAPKDEAFEAYYADFVKLTVEEREALAEQWEQGTYETVRFDSYVYSITGTTASKKINIPRSLTRNHIFSLDVVEIGINAVPNWTNIESISIPEEVISVYSDSFQNIPEGMVFNVEAPSLPDGWAADWAHGAKVNYGYSFPGSYVEEPSSRAGASSYGDPEQNFIIGWYPTEGNRLPLVAEYKVKKLDGSLSDTLYFDFSPTTPSSQYECVGFEIIDYSRSLDCDISLGEGEEIDFSTFRLHNIYKAVRNSEGKFVPDTTQAYGFTPRKMYSKVYTLSDFIKCSFTGISSFSGFTGIDLNIDISEANIYEQLKSNYYNAHKQEIESGAAVIRYRLTSLPLTSFRLTYENGDVLVTKDVKISTPIPQYRIASKTGNRVSFLLKNSDIGPGFDAKSIKSASLVTLFVSVDLMTNKAVIARSNVITRFGYVSIMPFSDNVKVFDLSLLLVLMLVGYVAAYAASATGLYFYLKNKYKNDEFRRMKTKKYVIKSLLGLLGSTIVIFALTFIVLSATAFNNAIVVFNPLDAYIIVLSVASVIIIGYFIKYLVGVIKVTKERRRILKLKLNEDVDDDGTN